MVNKFSEHLNSSHVVVDEKIIKMNEEKGERANVEVLFVREIQCTYFLKI